MKKLFVTVSLFFVSSILLGCDLSSLFSAITTPPLTTIDTTSSESVETTANVTDLTLALLEIYHFSFQSGSFSGTYEEWIETVHGPQGEAGKEVVLKVEGGFIQWQYVGESEWTNLIALTSLLGPKGDAGQEVVFQVTGGFIQWQYVGDSEWTNLIALNILYGPKGDQGEDGESAFEIYLKYHPEYPGDEEQWIHDLVNGLLQEFKKVTIFFETNTAGEVLVSAITETVGADVTKPEDPVWTGHTFEGWYTDELFSLPYIFSVMPSADLTLYARWTDLVIEDGPSGYTFLLKEDNTYEITAYSGTNTVLVIPSSYLGIAVTSIGTSTFFWQTDLTSITVSSGVISIGQTAFKNCSGLTTIILPEGVTTIGNQAFANCTSLSEITLPSTVTLIDFAAFSGCSALTEIAIPSQVMSLGEYTFDQCTSLTHITFESVSHVSSIGNFSFNGCSGLISITIPASVTNLGTNVFAGCLVLSIRVIATSIPAGWNAGWNPIGRPVEWGASE